MNMPEKEVKETQTPYEQLVDELISILAEYKRLLKIWKKSHPNDTEIDWRKVAPIIPEEDK